MKILCNPLNIEYQYQFCHNRDGHLSVNREAADPSMVLFKGKYYIFPSMSCGFWWSDDMEDWKFHPIQNLLVYDYAPDVRPVGDWLYFCASNHVTGDHYRTKDPFSDMYEKIEGSFPFWDPNLFEDEDGRIYFYWGSSPREPIYGIELDPETMKPLGEKVPLFANHEDVNGYERRGEDHIPARSEEEKQQILAEIEKQNLDPLHKQMAIDYIMDHGYIEGAWMTKHGGIYYLQYGASGAQFNGYADGVYVSDKPLGPFHPAKNNPFSYKPGGFLPGAGHGSTMTDRHGSTWHISTMRISVNHVFERRIGIWPAGWDADGEMFCNQRYGDWPYTLEQFRKDPWADPQWMLLSYGKKVTASSEKDGYEPSHAVDENVRTWWKAASNQPGEWICLDLGGMYDVHAVQINFADDHPAVQLPEGAKFTGDIYDSRWIDTRHQPTRWILEGSADGEDWTMLKDKSRVMTDLPHDLVVTENVDSMEGETPDRKTSDGKTSDGKTLDRKPGQGKRLRYIRLTVISVPYGQNPCVSGLRVFGLGDGAKPEKAVLAGCQRKGDLDMDLTVHGNGMGYVVNFGCAKDKLYHSYMTFTGRVHLGCLVKGQETWIRVDSFNENGITHGDVCRV